jgi:hypothetical protein
LEMELKTSLQNIAKVGRVMNENSL